MIAQYLSPSLQSPLSCNRPDYYSGLEPDNKNRQNCSDLLPQRYAGSFPGIDTVDNIYKRSEHFLAEQDYYSQEQSIYPATSDVVENPSRFV